MSFDGSQQGIRGTAPGGPLTFRGWLRDTPTNALSTFTFKAHDIRVIDRQGSPWFVAADVCRALELNQTGKHVSVILKPLALDEKFLADRQNTPNLFVGVRIPSATLISESGLYRLVMRSDKPEARAFQDWVTRDVLPAGCSHPRMLRDPQGRRLCDGEEKVRMGEIVP